MASTLMHIAIASEVNKYLNMDEIKLYLGTLAPDLSVELGEKKEISHFSDLSSESDIPNIDIFLKKYKKSLKKPFEMGYFIHLLADKYWYRDYINKYIERYTKNKEKKEITFAALKNIIYNDYTNINNDLLKEYHINKNIVDLLKNNEIETDITEISINKLNIIVDKLQIILEESHEDKTILFNSNEIKEYINNTVKYIIKDIELLKILEQ